MLQNGNFLSVFNPKQPQLILPIDFFDTTCKLGIAFLFVTSDGFKLIAAGISADGLKANNAEKLIADGAVMEISS